MDGLSLRAESKKIKFYRIKGFGQRAKTNQIIQSQMDWVRVKRIVVLASWDCYTSQELIEFKAISKIQFTIKPKGLRSKPKGIEVSRRDRMVCSIAQRSEHESMIICSIASGLSSTYLNDY